MKKVFFLFYILNIAMMGFAQTQTQKGISYRYNGKNPRTPLSKVTVECVTANNTVISDSTGSFTLTFNKLKMGDRIGLVTVKKREMMVFNQHAVDEWSIRKEPLCLILCDADEFDRQKREYMELGRNDAKRKYDRQKAELEKQLEEGKIKQGDLENALNVAYERLKKLQEEIDKYADDLARIDMSELDEKMQEILEMYQRGETEEAIERLKSLKLAEEFDKETAHNEAVQQELQKSDSKLQTLVEQMRSSVPLCMNSGEWEEAGKYLKRIADKTNNYDDVFEYAYFCASQNNHQEAVDYYNLALMLIDQTMNKDSRNYQYKRAVLLNNLGILYKNTQRLAESQTVYQEALELYRRLAKDNPQANEPYMATTLNNLGLLYSHTQRLAESETAYQEALEIRRRLAQANPPTYEPDLAMTLNNIGNLYSHTQRLTESETAYQEALELYRRLAKDNPQAYEPDVATTLNNTGNLYKTTQRFTESETVYQETLELYRRLAKDNPQAYEPYVASTLYNIGNLYKITQRLTESETVYQEALELYRRLAKDNPQAYEPYLAMTLNNLGALYYSTQRLAESETTYQEALGIRRRLAKTNPQVYEPDEAMTLYNMGLLYIQQEDYLKAIPVFEEALPIYRRLVQNNSTFENSYEGSLYWLTQLYPLTEEHAKYYEVNEEWLLKLKGWYQEDAESYQENYVNSLGNQSFQCIFVKQFEKAEQYAREGLSIDSSKLFIQTNLAASLLFQGKHNEAEAIYRQYKEELKDGFLQDLQDFEAAGVIPKERMADVERIRKMLSK